MVITPSHVGDGLGIIPDLGDYSIIYYDGNKAPASLDLPNAPFGWAWSLKQFNSFQWNLTASVARPNPQGSFHYGSIKSTCTIILVNSTSKVDGKLGYSINGVSRSNTNTNTSVKLAEYFGVANKVFHYNTIRDEPPPKIASVSIKPIVVNATYRKYAEIVLENREKSFMMMPGIWTPEKRNNFNLKDVVYKHTIQIFSNSWAAVLVTFDNSGMWNFRSQNKTYLGQQLYFSVVSPAKSF